MTTTDPTRERCEHELARGTCSICSGAENRLRHRADPKPCTYCKQDVVWVTTERGKSMPIDPDPSPVGRFRKERVVVQDGGKARRIVHYVRGDELRHNTRPLYACHWDTCTEKPKKEQQ